MKYMTNMRHTKSMVSKSCICSMPNMLPHMARRAEYVGMPWIMPEDGPTLLS